MSVYNDVWFFVCGLCLLGEGIVCCLYFMCDCFIDLLITIIIIIIIIIIIDFIDTDISYWLLVKHKKTPISELTAPLYNCLHIVRLV